MLKIIMLFISLILSCNIFATNNLRDPFLPVDALIPKINNQQTIVVPLYYQDASTIGKLLQNKNSHYLSATGHITIDKNNNSLWVSDTPAKIIAIKTLLHSIDKPEKQVQIAARIVNIDANFTRELGVEFGSNSNNNSSTPNSTGSLNMDIPLQAFVPGQFSFLIAKLSDDNMLNMELSALESEGHAKIISQPKLVTLNRQTAHIAAGEDIPYQEKTGQGNTSTTFKKAVLGLKVTPEITSHNQLLLKISVNQDQATQILINGVPAIQTREIQTEVLVHNNQTLVLGGIYEQSSNQVITGIPFLRSIPWLGVLFRKTETITKKKELLIFITPKIIH